MPPCRNALLAFLLCALASSPGARAQETSPGLPDSLSVPRVGVIGGHEFIPSSFIKDPFVRTYLQTGLGFGSTINRIAPPVTIQGKPLNGPAGDLMFALLTLEYQYAIREWVAVRGHLEVAGRMANETTTLVAQGVTLVTGFDLDWLFRVTQTERFSLSTSLGVRNASTTDLYLQRFIEGIVENGEVLPENRLVAETPVFRGIAGVQGIYVLSHLTGVTVSANIDYGESTDRGANDNWFYRLAVAFDFNLRSQNGTPIGFVLGGKTGSPPDIAGTDTRSAQTLFGRIAYTGADRFALGLDLAYNYIPIRNLEEKQNFLSAIVDIRLYF